MDNLWPFMIVTGLCCVWPMSTFAIGILIGKKGSPLHIDFGWKRNKAPKPHAESDAFRWEESS
jgi:hypothetical protein